MYCCFKVYGRLISCFREGVVRDLIRNSGRWFKGPKLLCSSQFGECRYCGERLLFAVDVSDMAGLGGCAWILSRFLYCGGAADGGMGVVGGWVWSHWLGG